MSEADTSRTKAAPPAAEEGPRAASPLGTAADPANAGAASEAGAAAEASEAAPSPAAGDPGEEIADETLMQRVQQHDDLTAFEQLFRRYEHRIFGFYVRQIRDRAIAEDYTQDVFTRLWSSRANYKPSGRFVNFIFQIARNHYINQNIRRTNRPDDAPIEAALGSPPDVHRDDRPVESLLRSELHGAIEQALLELPEEQREVFILSRFEKLKYQEIADLMDTPVRTVESRLVLATKKLMVKLTAFQQSR